MSLPFVPETMTAEEFEAHMKGAGSSAYVPGDDGVTVASVHYDHGRPTEPWIYDFFGVCGKYAQNEKKESYCAAWLHEPYTKRFTTLDRLSFYIAFVGLEYT